MIKLKLDDLKVQSFVTAGASKMMTIKGGSGAAGCASFETTSCNESVEPGCDDSYTTTSTTSGTSTGYTSITRTRPPLGD